LGRWTPAKGREHGDKEPSFHEKVTGSVRKMLSKEMEEGKARLLDSPIFEPDIARK
jgi:hypothetical protein